MSVKEVDIEAPAAARQEGTVILDVREAYEYEAGHMPGARWLPLGMLVGQLSRIPELLRRAGFEATSVAGGTTAWARSGRELEACAPAPGGGAAAR